MNHERFWEDLWNTLLQRTQTPVKGVLLERDQARELSEPILLRLMKGKAPDTNAPALSAEALEEASYLSKRHVASDRSETEDQDIHHDPEDKRYAQNLNLSHLKIHHAEKGFSHPEWANLDKLLRPLGFRILRNKGLQDEDGEEVFNETLAAMSLRKDDSQKAPIEKLTVFEEIIPNFCRRLGFKAIDLIRQKTAKKARPDHLESIDSMVTEDGTAVELPDASSSDLDRPESWRFEEIYTRCQELLSPLQWELIFDLYVAQNYTVKDLVADSKRLAHFGITADKSASTLRKRVDDIVNPALAQLALELSV